MTKKDETRQGLPSWAQAFVEQYFAPYGQKEELLRQIQEIREHGFPDQVIAEAVAGLASRDVKDSERTGGTLADHILRAVAEKRLRDHVDGIINRLQTSKEMMQWASDPSEDWSISDE